MPHIPRFGGPRKALPANEPTENPAPLSQGPSYHTSHHPSYPSHPSDISYDRLRNPTPQKAHLFSYENIRRPMRSIDRLPYLVPFRIGPQWVPSGPKRRVTERERAMGPPCLSSLERGPYPALLSPSKASSPPLKLPPLPPAQVEEQRTPLGQKPPGPGLTQLPKLPKETEEEAAARREEEAVEAVALKEKEEEEAAALREKREAEAAALRKEKEAEAAALKEREEAEAAALREKEEAEAAALKEKKEAEAAALREKEEAEAAAAAEVKRQNNEIFSQLEEARRTLRRRQEEEQEARSAEKQAAAAAEEARLASEAAEETAREKDAREQVFAEERGRVGSGRRGESSSAADLGIALRWYIMHSGSRADSSNTELYVAFAFYVLLHRLNDQCRGSRCGIPFAQKHGTRMREAAWRCAVDEMTTAAAEAWRQAQEAEMKAKEEADRAARAAQEHTLAISLALAKRSLKEKAERSAREAEERERLAAEAAEAARLESEAAEEARRQAELALAQAAEEAKQAAEEELKAAALKQEELGKQARGEAALRQRSSVFSQLLKLMPPAVASSLEAERQRIESEADNERALADLAASEQAVADADAEAKAEEERMADERAREEAE
ncbi:MAG: hypothetical protein SGPRY_004552, partial [Prymnesium sp.]